MPDTKIKTLATVVPAKDGYWLLVNRDDDTFKVWLSPDETKHLGAAIGKRVR